MKTWTPIANLYLVGTSSNFTGNYNSWFNRVAHLKKDRRSRLVQHGDKVFFQASINWMEIKMAPTTTAILDFLTWNSYLNDCSIALLRVSGLFLPSSKLNGTQHITQDLSGSPMGCELVPPSIILVLALVLTEVQLDWDLGNLARSTLWLLLSCSANTEQVLWCLRTHVLLYSLSMGSDVAMVGSAPVFGWVVCVKWHPHECQDPEFLSRAFLKLCLIGVHNIWGVICIPEYVYLGLTGTNNWYLEVIYICYSQLCSSAQLYIAFQCL